MSENLKNVNSDEDFKKHLKDAGKRLIVVDFCALWCCQCQTMGPVFDRLAPRFPLALFLKGNVDECTLAYLHQLLQLHRKDTAIALGVKCLPAFLFFRGDCLLDDYRYSGCDESLLEDMIKKSYVQFKEELFEMDGHQMCLSSFIDLYNCDCLNENPKHGLIDLITDTGYLESYSNEKLMITVAFRERVDVQSLKIKAPSGCGPRKVKLFANQPISDIQDGEETQSDETLELIARDLDGQTLLQLSSPRFKSVTKLVVCITSNQDASSRTILDKLQFFGGLSCEDIAEGQIGEEESESIGMGDDADSASEEEVLSAGMLNHVSLETVLRTAGMELLVKFFDTVDKSWISLRSLTIKNLQDLGIDSESARMRLVGLFEAFWHQLAFQFKHATFVKMQTATFEYKNIEKLMQSTIVPHRGVRRFDRYLILMIQRIVNPKLQRRYNNVKDIIMEDRGIVAERSLFHGSLFWRDITENGFNVQLSDPSSMFGPGIYFAEHSSKSNQYVFGGADSGCPKHGSRSCTNCPRQLLLCDVVLGKTAKLSESEKSSHGPVGYDSVTGVATGFPLQYPEYVTYQNYQANPTHLITYKIQRDRTK